MKTALTLGIIACVLIAALAPAQAWADGGRFADPWRAWGVFNRPHRVERPVVVTPQSPQFVVPFPGAVWVPGYWGWNGWSWVWVPGYWTE